jgi:preprotein translocase subunit SecG
MATVLLVIHLMIAATLVGVVLLQKSEGGALGIGGGGGFMTGRGTANLLTRVTAMLAAAFFTTSILLSILARQTAPVGSVFDATKAASPPAAGAPATPGEPAKAPEGRGGILDKIQPPPAVQIPGPNDVPQNR